MLTRELKLELEKIFVKGESFCNLYITVMSFGFKYGIPQDADLVFDVRFLPNPYYIDELKEKTGNDPEVQDYVMENEKAQVFLDKLTDMVDFLIPNYILEGKNQLYHSDRLHRRKAQIRNSCECSVPEAGQTGELRRPHRAPGYRERCDHKKERVRVCLFLEKYGKNSQATSAPASHCQIAELAAFIGLCGTIVFNRFDRCSIKIHSENFLVARKVFTLIEKTFNIRTDISVRRNIAKQSVSYAVIVTAA